MSRGRHLYGVNRARLATAYFALGVILLSSGIAASILIPTFKGLAKDKVVDVEGFVDTIDINYLDTPDFSSWKIHLENGYGDKKTLDGNSLMVEGFDGNELGSQNLTLSYLNWKGKVTCNVGPLKLAATSISFQDGILSWQPVEHASYYRLNLYKGVNLDEGFGEPIKVPSAALKYDLRQIDYHGEFAITVTACSDEISPRRYTKFSPSEPSKAIRLIKLQEIGKLSYDGENFNWLGIPGVSSYTLKINEESHIINNETSYHYDLSLPGDYQVTLIPNGPNNYTFGKPLTDTFTRLSAPSLSISNQQIHIHNAESPIYYLDGKEFNGQVASINEEGVHLISAKNVGDGIHRFDSPISEELMVTRLWKPSISIENGVISASSIGAYDPTLYLDDELWDGQMSQVDVGEHQVYARLLPSASWHLQSDKSNIITLTRLATPEFDFDGVNLNERNISVGHTIYVDGELSSFDVMDENFIASLSGGLHRIEAINLGNGNDILPSSKASLNLLVPSYDISIAKSSENPDKDFTINIIDTSGYSLIKDDKRQILEAEVRIDFYQGNSKIDSISWSPWPTPYEGYEGEMETYQFGYHRGDGIADEVVVMVKMIPPEGSLFTLQTPIVATAKFN